MTTTRRKRTLEVYFNNYYDGRTVTACKFAYYDGFSKGKYRFTTINDGLLVLERRRVFRVLDWSRIPPKEYKRGAMRSFLRSLENEAKHTE